MDVFEACEPVYETLPGWKTSTVGALEEDQLPAAARDYVRWIEEQLEVPVATKISPLSGLDPANS